MGLPRLLVKMVEVVESFGFSFFLPPLLEEVETYQRNYKNFYEVATTVGDKVIRLDFTSQIVKYAKHYKNFPKKVYYFGEVLRSKRSEFHFGVEVLGTKKGDADSLVVEVLSKCLERAGIEHSIFVGHSGIVKKVLRKLPKGSLLYLKEKNLTYLKKYGLRELSLNLGEEETLRELPKDFEGEREELLRLFYSLRDKVKAKIFFEPLEVRNLPYYTGITFEIYLKNLSAPVGGGGRYSHGVGGTLYLNLLEGARSPQGL